MSAENGQARPYADFGATIARLRQARDLTQTELAHKAQIHQSWLSRIEAGKRMATVPQIERLANVLGVKAGDLWDAMIVEAARAVPDA